MTARFVEKLNLSAQGLLSKTREAFTKVHEPSRGPQGKRKSISIVDCLMSGLAIFKLKFPSLLQFETGKKDEIIKQNLKNLFKLRQMPCDTYMRERLDYLDPKEIRPAFKAIFSTMQRGKILERYQFINGKYLVLSDGSGYFSSQTIHCDNCCMKHYKDGSIAYYHQFLGAVIAHPDRREVIPICPEPIMKEDGSKKNDCERNATERLLRDFRREHPHLQVVWVEDALAANGPHLKLLRDLDISFITVVKPEGNKSLFDWVATFDWKNISKEDEDSHGEFTLVDKEKKRHKFRYVNRVPLNDSHVNFLVNFLEYWEINDSGKVTYHNTWITDIGINPTNAKDIARGGRARWRIENETFNTLKNQGYQFEHNYGHGEKNLSTIFAMLMMLAFLIDQCEQISCGLFQNALKHMKRKTYLWERVRGFFTFHIIPSWEALYKAIVVGCHPFASVLDTS